MRRLVRDGRDLRVDFFRGIALFFIFLDHIPHDTLARFTVRNIALNDATEIFILLAGFAAALVYGRAMDRSGPVSASADMLKRAWTLYIAHIFLFVIFVAQVSLAAIWLARPQYIADVGVSHLVAKPLSAIIEVVPMLYQPAYLNVLPLYVAIMGGIAPLIFLLRFPRTLLGLSITLYAAARIQGWNLPTHGGRGWFFDPFTWQLLFVLGMLFARQGRPKLPGRLTDAVAVILLAIGFSILLTTWLEPSLAKHIPFALRPFVANIDKTGLHPYRLASILALAWLVARHMPPTARFLGSRLARVFVLIGQHGLPTYCASILLSYAGRIVMDTDDGWLMQIVVNLAGLAALHVVASIAAWYKVKDAKPSAA